MLECKNLTKKFGGLVALNDFNCNVNENDILGLVGPNGSGKTTFLNLVMNVYQPSSGTILFQGEKINGLKPNKIVHLGISKTNQIPKPFLHMSVLQNVAMGGIFGGRLNMKEAMKRATELLEFVGLSEMKDELPGKLTGVQLKLLELARALATQPKLLLLDEVAAGMSELEIKQVQSLVKHIQTEGITIIWVEHILEAVVEVCNRLICLNEGKKIAEGVPREVIKDEKVVEVYLGEKIC